MARELFRSRPKAVEFDIAGLLSDLGGKSGLLCLSETTWELAYNLVLYYGYWRSRYYYRDPASGEAQTLTDEEYDQITDVVDLAIEELQMTGCSDITDALTSLTNAVTATGQAGGCCDNYGSIPSADADPGDPDTETVPDGYPGTWSEYQTYKCSAAQAIADDVIATTDNLQTLGGVGAVLGSAALAAFLSTSLLSGVLVGVMALGFSAGAGAAIVIGALIALIIGNSAQFALFADLSDDLETDRDDLVCTLFNSADIPTAMADLTAFIVARADVSEPFYGVVEALLSGVVNADMLNPLYVEDPSYEGYGGDCDGCAGCASAMIYGTGDPVAGGTMDAEMVSSANWQVHFYIESPKQVDISNLTGWSEYTGSTPDVGWTETYRVLECDGTFPGWDHESEIEPPLANYPKVSRLKITSATEFSVDVAFSEV